MHEIKVIILNLGLSFFAIAVISTAFLLDRYIPFLLPECLILAAWPLFLMGGSLILWAVIILARSSGASGTPGDPTRKLVTDGPYAWIRNSIYEGDAVIILGLAFYSQSPSMLLYALLFVMGVDLFVRFFEEPATENRFGKEYMRYKEEVPRWFPDIRQVISL